MSKFKKLIFSLKFFIGLWIFSLSFMVYVAYGTDNGTFVSAQTGNWNIGTTWGGACASACTAGVDYPGSLDAATIAITHIVTVPAGTFNFSTIAIDGTLILVGNIAGADITVRTGGILEQKNVVQQVITGTLDVQSGGTLRHTANT
ncbi:MAG: hypothetical protein ACD_28C00178G0007, partial [uncultured bacterium]